MTFNKTLLFDSKVHRATPHWNSCPYAGARDGDYDCHKTTLVPSDGVQEEGRTIGTHALKERKRSGGMAEISPPDILNWASRYFS